MSSSPFRSTEYEANGMRESTDFLRDTAEFVMPEIELFALKMSIPVIPTSYILSLLW